MVGECAARGGLDAGAVAACAEGERRGWCGGLAAVVASGCAVWGARRRACAHTPTHARAGPEGDELEGAARQETAALDPPHT